RLVAQPGPPSPTAGELLCTLPDDKVTDNRTAALVPEFLMISGVGCDSNTRTPRMAQYPEDVPGMEPRFVRVRWRGGDRDAAARDAAAAAFRDWLAGPRGRAEFARAGLRDPGSRMLLDPERGRVGGLYVPARLGCMDRRGRGPCGAPGLGRQSRGGCGGRGEYGVWGVGGEPGRPYRTVLLVSLHRGDDAERSVTARDRALDAEADAQA